MNKVVDRQRSKIYLTFYDLFCTMGVYGLWRLLDATGKPVPVDTLEGKVLAVDISIWIHQVLQGYQDRYGNPKPNAHLLGLFNRVCKLLYYKIKPVFVFDGGVPMLKRNTIASRRKQKSIAMSKAQKMKADLINNLIKHTAVKTALNTDDSNGKDNPVEVPHNLKSKTSVNDMFKLPVMPDTSKTEIDLSDEYDSESTVELSPRKQTKWTGNIHDVDVTRAEFKALPADVRYDILTDLKETRKQNSWGRLHEMPEETHDFSGFQMKRLLKRRLVQECLESAEKEMGGKTLTLEELDKLLTEQGISTKGRDSAYRIASDSKTRLIYISDKDGFIKSSTGSNVEPENRDVSEDVGITEPIAGPSKTVPIFEDMNEYELNDEWDSDTEFPSINNSEFMVENSSEDEIGSDVESQTNETDMNESRPLAKKYFGKNVMNPALTYMLEYSGLTQKQILTLLKENRKEESKAVNSRTERSKKTDSSVATGSKSINNLSNSEQSALLSVDVELEKTGKEKGKTCERAMELNNKSDCKISNGDVSFKEVDSVVIVDDEKTQNQSVSSSTAMQSTVTVYTTSESDSDDFVEIKDVPVPDTDAINENSSKSNIEITFRSDQTIEDDIFADIFAATNADVHGAKNIQNTRQHHEAKGQTPENNLSELIVKSSDEQSREIRLSSTIRETDPKRDRSVDPENIVDEEIQPERNKDREKGLYDTEGAVSGINGEKEANTKDDTIKIIPLPVNEDELLSLKAQLEDEQDELSANIGKLERQATDISDQIRIEAQELLRLFGIPYIVAPMEAEAQCAYLEQIRLTDGTITDDSDIWLFGGQCVYKNFFNNNKRVLQFRSGDIKHHFSLTRNEMIQLALLVGSDYTTGLTGIGPVTALEILAAFPAEGDNLLRGLTNFCSWMKSGRMPAPGRTGLRSKLRNVEIEKGFPSQAVVQAYLFPTVDESKEAFTWGKPNIVLLSDYARSKFGWSKSKFEEIMKPVIKRLEESKSQKLIDAYLKVQTVPKSIEMNLSKRIRKAVQRLNNEESEEPANEANDTEKMSKRRKNARTEAKTEEQEELEIGWELSGEPKIFEASSSVENNVKEYIPQREKDKAEALKKKLHAIEVLRKSKRGLNKSKKVKRCTRKVKKEAELSESDSSGS